MKRNDDFLNDQEGKRGGKRDAGKTSTSMTRSAGGRQGRKMEFRGWLEDSHKSTRKKGRTKLTSLGIKRVGNGATHNPGHLWRTGTYAERGGKKKMGGGRVAEVRAPDPRDWGGRNPLSRKYIVRGGGGNTQENAIPNN